MRRKMQGLAAAIMTLFLILTGVGVLPAFADTDFLTVDVEVTYDQSSARSMLQMVNDFRTGATWYWNADNASKTTIAEGGRSALTYNYELERIAMQRAAEIAVSYSHTRPNGTNWDAMLNLNVFNSCGENIAAGYTTTAGVFRGWQEENENYYGQGHRRNMLDSGFTAIGIGHVIYNGTHYWVQEFGAPTSSAAQTETLDGEKRCEVEIAKNKIVSLAMDDLSVEVEYGESVVAPEPAFTLKMDKFWGNYGPGKVIPRLTWTITDTSIAQSQNGKITGKKVGKTVAGAFFYYVTAGSDKKYTYDITVKPISLKDNNAAVSGISGNTYTYTGSDITPDFSVTCKGKTLVKGSDYTVSYSNNRNVGQASVTVTGKSNYKDSVTATFRIVPKELNASMMAGKIADVTYSGSEQKPSVSLKDGNMVLQEGKNYTVSYSSNVNAGTAAVKVTGKGNYTGTLTGQFHILQRDIADAAVTKIPDQEYSGKAIKPALTVTVGGRRLVSGKDYQVSFSNNIKIGTATVKAAGSGNYTGSITTSFVIKEVSITISKTPASVKAKVKKKSKAKVIVSWKKIKKNKAGKKLLKKIKSIQVQYSTDKTFKQNVKTKTVGKKKTKATLKLQKKTTYYVRVRYKGADGFSKWSKVKRVKTKK